MTKDRKLLAQLIKNWAQDHDHSYQIADPDQTDEGITNTAQFLSWIIKEGNGNLDLLTLLDRLELFIENRRKRNFPDGMYCKQCNSFYDFADSNQSDGSLICYSCRENPFH